MNKSLSKRRRIKGFCTHCFLISKISADGIITLSVNSVWKALSRHGVERVEWGFLQPSSSSSSRDMKTKYVFPLEVVKDSMSLEENSSRCSSLASA